MFGTLWLHTEVRVPDCLLITLKFILLAEHREDKSWIGDELSWTLEEPCAKSVVRFRTENIS